MDTIHPIADTGLAIRRNGAVGELILDKPDRRNALSLKAWTALPDVVKTLVDDSKIRVIVVHGTGQSFCAGADISEFEATRSTPEKANAYDLANVKAFESLKAAPKPTLAKIRGHCLGGGLGVALACDLRIACRSALFGIPAAQLGLAYPPRALAHLLEAVSPASAKRLLFTAKRIHGEDALNMGLIDELVHEDALDTHVDELCRTISTNAPLSMKAAKLAIDAFSQPPLEKELAHAEELATECIQSEDYAEGYRSFLEKRLPVFKGK